MSLMSEGYDKKSSLLEAIIVGALKQRFEFDEEAGPPGAVAAAVLGPYKDWRKYQTVDNPRYMFRDAFMSGVYAAVDIVAALMNENPLTASSDLNQVVDYHHGNTMEVFNDFFDKKPQRNARRTAARKRAA